MLRRGITPSGLCVSELQQMRQWVASRHPSASRPTVQDRSRRREPNVDATLQTKPEGITHWSCRTMAQSRSVSKSTINNIWQARQLNPHRVKTCKLSRDPSFSG